MTQRDRGTVAVLSAILVVLALALAMPTTGSAPAVADASPSPSADIGTGNPPIYREGVIGAPSSINPLTARTQADRDLSKLIFSGLVARGPGATYLPDLASSWTADPTGRTWTFQLRPGATWQDGQPVTADDVVFTVTLIKDPAYRGPLANSWREVSVVKLDSSTVEFTLDTPISGFLEDAMVGILPQHLLNLTPVTGLADSSFSNNPVGSGPFRLVNWDVSSAELVPTASTSGSSGATPAASAPASAAAPTSAPASSAGSPSAAGASAGSEPVPAIELEFFGDSASLAAAYRAGSLDAASGLSPTDATALAALPGSRLLSYPSTTFTSVAMNLRPANTVTAPAAVRRAFLEALDRPAMISSVLDGTGRQADSPIPPSSWAFDAGASAPVASNPTTAAAALKTAGWTKGTSGWLAPKAKTAFSFDLLSPDQASNPIAWATAELVTGQWQQ
ncbi:MAG TPA: ABC transporter substrate-binding protein, partial [Candidatus Limnocylindrales bacterium]